MINIEERKTVKVPGQTSLFVSFDFNKAIIDELKLLNNIHYDSDTKEWEIPITVLSEFIDRVCKLDSINIHLAQDDSTGVAPLQIVDKYQFKTTPFDYQLDGINYGLNNHDKWLLLDAPGLGKAVSLDTTVYTPYGVTTMGNIKVGDVVIDKEGKPCQVLAVYDHDDLTMYRVTFSDGLTIDCCEDHQWLLSDGRTVSTKWFLENDSRHSYRRIDSKNKPYAVPLTKPIEFDYKDVPVDAYVLGALLGDGSISNGLSITSVDEHIVDRIQQRLPQNLELRRCGKSIDYRIAQKKGQVRYQGFIWYADGQRVGTTRDMCQYLSSITGKYYSIQTTPRKVKQCIADKTKFEGITWSYRREVGNPLGQTIIDLNLVNCTSHTKFIPDLYKYNSIETRLELIRGLFDTDGYAATDNHLSYTTVSEQLCDDVREVIESLGGICHKKVGPCYYNGNYTGLSYTLTIRSSDPSLFVTLPRKKSRLRPRSRGALPKRKFEKIEPISLKTGRCITVDSPSKTYLINGCCVTHNTLQLIYLAQELKRRYGVQHCLVVCGINTLKTNWKSEIEKHSDLSCTILGQRINKKGKLVIDGVDKRVAQLKNPIDEFFTITNIETLRSDKIIEAINKGPNKFDMIIVDEAHVIKSPTSAQTKNLLKIKHGRYRVAATGTLLMNNPMDCYIPLKWIGKERCTYSNFKYYYCSYGGIFGNELVGFKNLDVLKLQLDSCSLRRTKDILKLPPKTVINEYVELNPDQEVFYENIKQGIVDQVDKVHMSTANLLAMVSRLRQATACPSVLTTENISSSKVERTIDLAEQIVSSGEKVVIFSTFKETVYQLKDRLNHLGLVVGTGDNDDSEIEEAKQAFQNDSNIKVFLGTTAKCGTGITLTAASYMIFIDHPWTAAGCEQAEDRIHRIGTNKSVTIYRLISKNTIDERVLELVNDKKALSSYIIDDEVPAEYIDSLRKYIMELS